MCVCLEVVDNRTNSKSYVITDIKMNEVCLSIMSV